MSTIRFKKDHGDKKAGTFSSVPFLIGKELVATGVAEYAPGGVVKPKVEPPRVEEPPKAPEPPEPPKSEPPFDTPKTRAKKQPSGD